MNLFFASKLSSSKWVEVDDIRDEAPLLWVESVVPLDKRELDRRQRHKGLALVDSLHVVAELEALVVEPVRRFHCEPPLLLLELLYLLPELVKLLIAVLLGNVNKVLVVVDLLQLVRLVLQVVNVLSQLLGV